MTGAAIGGTAVAARLLALTGVSITRGQVVPAGSAQSHGSGAGVGRPCLETAGIDLIESNGRWKASRFRKPQRARKVK
jgi:hypothetical protein